MTTLAPKIRTAPRVLSDYFSLNGIVSVLFTVLGLIAAGTILTLAATQGASAPGLLEGIASRNSVYSWFISVVLAFSAVTCISLASLSARRDDRRTWQIFGVFLGLVSCQEVATLRDAAGWAYFNHDQLQHMPYVVLALLFVPFLVLGLFLSRALRDSVEAAACLSAGAVMFCASAVVQALTMGEIFSSSEPRFWSFILISVSLAKALGAIVLFAGFLIQERFLASSLRRVTSPVHFGLPEVTSDNMEWALRMIDTPTRDEIKMMEEVRRARQAEKERVDAKGRS